MTAELLKTIIESLLTLGVGYLVKDRVAEKRAAKKAKVSDLMPAKPPYRGAK